MEADNYALDCFRRCPQYYRRRIYQSLVKSGKDSTALAFGTSIHLGMEVYYKEGMTDTAIQVALAAFETSFTPFADEADDKRTVARGLYILDKYFQRYREEPFEVVAAEVGGAMDLGGGHTYTSRLDLIVEWKSPKGIYIIDHKTTSSIDSMVVKPCNQLTGYIATVTDMYADSYVLGAMFNLLGVYKTEKMKDKESGKMVEREILRRVTTSRTPIELASWRREVLHTIHQIEECMERDVWPKYDNCKKYRTWCPFLDLCNSDETTAQRMIDGGFYIKQPWSAYDPTSEDESNET